MKLQPLTMEVYNRLLEDGYTHFKIKHSYDKQDFGTDSNVTMLEAVKAEKELLDGNYLSPQVVTELLDKRDASYCVMTF